MNDLLALKLLALIKTYDGVFTYKSDKNTLILFNSFLAAQGWGGGKKIPLSKISQIYPILMKFGKVIAYLKKIQKIYKSRDMPPEF